MRKRITRVLMVAALVGNLGVGLIAVASGARADSPTGSTGPAIDNVLPTPPGNSGDNPGSPGNDCSQGNSGATCVPDPNVNGQDCLDHGNAAGNENHCEEGSPSPSPSPSPGPTESPSPEPTESPSSTPTESSSTPPPVVVPTTPAPSPPVETGSPTTAPKTPRPSSRSGSKPPKGGGNENRTRTLAFTGAGDTERLGFTLILLSLLGLFAMGLARIVGHDLSDGMDRRNWRDSKRNL
jgi:hypothetical protein